jgi:hypothetical protein
MKVNMWWNVYVPIVPISVHYLVDACAFVIIASYSHYKFGIFSLTQNFDESLILLYYISLVLILKYGMLGICNKVSICNLILYTSLCPGSLLYETFHIFIWILPFTFSFYILLNGSWSLSTLSSHVSLVRT